ncbi:hypothetical protein [Streptomyces sp. NPDC090025]|uniref:hypothetical protein n=1 Tax=Streptomyces sp. NPDC090025 TaxID=3365922 RepID=UPI0038325F32
MNKPSTGRRRTARLGACAAAAGLVTVGLTAGPAFADSDQLWISSSPYELVLPRTAAGVDLPATTLTLGLSHDNSDFRVTDGRITVDVSGLAGIAVVDWPAACAPAPSGTSAECAVDEVTGTGNASATPLKLAVRAAAGAADGASGRISYTAKATTTGEGGQLVAENWGTVRVASGPDLVLDRTAPVTGVAPGATVPVPVSVTNRGDQAAQGVRATFYVTRGLTLNLGGLAPKCVSTPIGEGGPGSGAIKPLTKVECVVDTVVQPGGTFPLPAALTAKAARFALAERIDIGVEAATGPADIQPENNGDVLAVGVTNTADFAVTGARLTAAAGETVTAPVTFRNRGPAWVANLTSGDPVAKVDVTVPRGATVTTVPDGCEPRTADGGWWESETRTGAPRYECGLPLWVAERQTVTFPFGLRVDTVVKAAKGEVVLKPSYGTQRPVFDPNAGNERARLVLNP